MLTGPTLLDGVPDHRYHSGGIDTPGPQLSQSLIKLLIPPSTPAHFQWRLTHPEGPKRVFDVGRAAHTYALGVGEEMAACPDALLAVNGAMTTKASREWCAEQRAAGIVPLTPADHRMVLDMADALVRHDRVAELLTDPTKRPEVSAYAPIPDAGGLWLRGRFDLLGGLLFDYKTSRCAHPDAFRKSAWSYGYHIQDAAYRLLAELTLGEDPGPMVFVVQEKTPPYLCSTVTLDREFERLAREQLRLALDTYAACREVWGDPRGPVRWPGYPDEVVTISPPPYATAASGPLSDEDDTEGDADELLAQLEGLMA